MATVRLRYIHPGYKIQDELNCNFADISAGFEDVLSRNSREGNQMNAPLDMNGWPIINAIVSPDPLIPETIYEGSVSAGELTIDPKKFLTTITLTEDVTGFAQESVPCYPGFRRHWIEVTQDATGGHTFALPSVYNPSAINVNTTANSITLIGMYTKDEGATWYVFDNVQL